MFNDFQVLSQLEHFLKFRARLFQMKIRHVPAAFQRLLSKAILASSWLELGKPIKRKEEKFT
jgi:hypothetical protein